MLRFLLWAMFAVCTLNTISFDIKYADGMHIKSVGWPEKLTNWLKKRKRGE